MPRSNHDSSDAAKPQPDKFREAARELGCDEDEARFEETVRKVAKAPKSDEKPRPDGD